MRTKSSMAMSRSTYSQMMCSYPEGSSGSSIPLVSICNPRPSTTSPTPVIGMPSDSFSFSQLDKFSAGAVKSSSYSSPLLSANRNASAACDFEYRRTHSATGIVAECMTAPQLLSSSKCHRSVLRPSLMSIIDGLSTDLWHLLEESNCGAVIHSATIPVAECVRRYSKSHAAEALRLALNSGEEYELLFTAPAENLSSFEKLNESLGIPITGVGEVVEGRGLQIETSGILEPLLPSGYEHII